MPDPSLQTQPPATLKFVKATALFLLIQVLALPVSAVLLPVLVITLSLAAKPMGLLLPGLAVLQDKEVPAADSQIFRQLA